MAMLHFYNVNLPVNITKMTLWNALGSDGWHYLFWPIWTHNNMHVLHFFAQMPISGAMPPQKMPKYAWIMAKWPFSHSNQEIQEAVGACRAKGAARTISDACGWPRNQAIWFKYNAIAATSSCCHKFQLSICLGTRTLSVRQCIWRAVYITLFDNNCLICVMLYYKLKCPFMFLIRAFMPISSLTPSLLRSKSPASSAHRLR